MFGMNPVFKQRATDQYNGTVWLQEVFTTLQGEGPYQGRAAVFVRFAGCNLRCEYCDTNFTSSDWTPRLEFLCKTVTRRLWDIPASTNPRDLVKRRLVVITGGEPYAQPQALTELVNFLLRYNTRDNENGVDVQIETSGSLFAPDLGNIPDDECCGRLMIVCSPKTPKLDQRFLRLFRGDLVYKYVLRANEVGVDGLPSRHPQRNVNSDKQVARPPAFATVYGHAV